MMTKKDFIALAEGLKHSRPVDTMIPALREMVDTPLDTDYGVALAQWRADRESVIVTCYASNPRFDRAHFTEWTER